MVPRDDGSPLPTGSGPLSSSGQPIAVNANLDLPYEQRVVAKIGGFLFDSPAADMLNFAKEKLAEAGIPSDRFRHLHCPHTTGSWVLLTFMKPEYLQDARMAFQSSSFRCADRKIWLDAAKTRAELKPARIIHRAYTAITEQEKDQTEPKTIEKNLRGKQIKTGNIVLAFTLNGQLKWTAAARARYTEETCEMLAGWIEAE